MACMVSMGNTQVTGKVISIITQNVSGVIKSFAKVDIAGYITLVNMSKVVML